MNEDLTALALSGAQTVVTAMATDMWGNLRQRLGAVLGKGDEKLAGKHIERLDAVQVDLQQSSSERPDSIRDRSVARLQDRFYDFLEENPDAIQVFAALTSEARQGLQTSNNVAWQQISVKGNGRAFTVGNGSINVHEGK